MPFPEACPSLVDNNAVVGGGSTTTTAAVPQGPATAAANELPSITTDESDEDSDLGEFLLDAVQWL